MLHIYFMYISFDGGNLNVQVKIYKFLNKKANL